MEFSKIGSVLGLICIAFVIFHFLGRSQKINLWMVLSTINYSVLIYISSKFKKERFGTLTRFFKRMVLAYGISSALPWIVFPWAIHFSENVTNADRVFAILLSASVSWGAVFMICRVFVISLIYSIGVTASLVGYVLVTDDPLTNGLISWIIMFQSIVMLFGMVEASVGKERDQAFSNLTKSEQKATRIAYLDAVTGMMNRAAFNRDLKLKRKHIRDADYSLILAVFDLNLFKNINDAHGHHIGDLVLREVAQRFREHADEKWKAYRLGGDEFGFMIENYDHEQGNWLLNQIINEISIVYSLDTLKIEMSTSVGAARYPDQPFDQLLSSAELALRAAKRASDRSLVWFNDELDALHQEILSFDGEIRRAMDEDRVEVWYQPQYNFKTNRICGIEALCRIPTSSGEYLDAQRVFDVSEMRGLSHRLSMKIFDILEKNLPALLNYFDDATSISINIAPSDLKTSTQLIDRLIKWKSLGFETRRICIEITEECLIGRGSGDSVKALEQISALGYTLALDDFGTGHASLSHLRDISINELKVDKLFVGEIEDKKNEAILAGIIDITQRMGIACVVEGIETKEQFMRLTFMNAEVGQGYFWSRPVPLDELFDVQNKRDDTVTPPEVSASLRPEFKFTGRR